MKNQTTADPFIRTHLALVPMVVDEAEAVPPKVKAFPWGAHELRDAQIRETYLDEPGTLEANERTAEEVPKNFAARDVDYFVNVNHETYGEAVGWIDGVEVSETEGILISVSWTPTGERLVREKAYRYSSIEVILDTSGWYLDGSPAVIVAVVGLAIVNRPAVVGQAPVSYNSLQAALSASDGRELDKRKQTPGNPGEKGESRMDGNLFEKLFSRIAGRTPTDEVDAATIAAELTAMRESATGLAAERDALASQVTELTEKLEKTKSKVSEYEAAEEDRRKADLTAKVATAIAEGRLHQGLKEEAEKDPERFLAAAEKTPKGLYSPPKGRQVTVGAIESAEGGLGEIPREALMQEVALHAKENNISISDAYIAVVKARSVTAAGKGA